LDFPRPWDLARRMGMAHGPAGLRSVGVYILSPPDVEPRYGISESNIAATCLSRRPEVLASGLSPICTAAGCRHAATAKHFPAHAAVVAHSHSPGRWNRRELPDLSDDLGTLPLMISNGLPAVMVLTCCSRR